MNLCTGCGEDFGSITAFDAHRIGAYPQAGPPEYCERLRQGLVNPEEEWRSNPRFGRRCLSPDEMQAKRMQKDECGRWRLAVRGTPPWTSDIEAQNGRKQSSRPVPAPRAVPPRRRRTSPRSGA